MHRPQSLKDVAEAVNSLPEFGRAFADWLHTIRGTHTRHQVRDYLQAEPPLLAKKFPEGDIADAWLGAYAEYTAQAIGAPIPEWTHNSERIAPVPWFSIDGEESRLLALRDSPPPFKNRNLFTPKVDLPLRLRAGRPPVSAEHKRRKNAERQRRFRARRAAELAALRASSGRPDRSD